MRKAIMSLAILFVVAVPSSAQGASIRQFNIQDTGTQVNYGLTICTKLRPQIRILGIVEHGETFRRFDWRSKFRPDQKGCWRYTWTDVADPTPAWPLGRYFTRLRVTIRGLGFQEFTPWRKFRVWE